MGSDIILCMALIASFAFVIQFLLSILGSDLDTDIDIDSASDLSMSLSDIISFYRRNPDLSLTGFTSTKETERSPRGCIKTDK